MLIDAQSEFLKDIAKLLTKCFEMGYKVTGGECWRPPSQAWINSRPAGSTLYARDKENNIHTYPVPIGGVGISTSKHLDRLAFDFNFFDKSGKQITTKEDLQVIGNYWQSLNQLNKWGGNFTTRLDCPHFERRLPNT